MKLCQGLWTLIEEKVLTGVSSFFWEKLQKRNRYFVGLALCLISLA